MRRKNTTKTMMKEYMAESLLWLLQRKAFADISISEITDKAGVNRATYYRNFTSKEEIVRFYLRGIMGSFLRNMKRMMRFLWKLICSGYSAIFLPTGCSCSPSTKTGCPICF